MASQVYSIKIYLRYVTSSVGVNRPLIAII